MDDLEQYQMDIENGYEGSYEVWLEDGDQWRQTAFEYQPGESHPYFVDDEDLLEPEHD